jgi:hypothetical protein
MSRETADLVFVFSPETGVDLGNGDLAHEAPFADVCVEALVGGSVASNFLIENFLFA